MEELIMNSQPIPTTDSIEELAQFWDKHDLTEFEDQLEIVTESIFEKNTTVEITLQSQEIEKVKQLAKLKGINYLDLIQEWILEKVQTV